MGAGRPAQQHMKILVVDDEPFVADAIADSVRAQGHDAFVAHDSQEAFQAIDRVAPDAVLLDLVMPGASGIQVLERIRASHRRLPVVVVSGRATDEMLAEAKRLGITGVLEKPVTLTHLDWMLAVKVFKRGSDLEDGVASDN